MTKGLQHLHYIFVKSEVIQALGLPVMVDKGHGFQWNHIGRNDLRHSLGEVKINGMQKERDCYQSVLVGQSGRSYPFQPQLFFGKYLPSIPNFIQTSSPILKRDTMTTTTLTQLE